MSDRIFLDHVSTTPVDERVLEAMMPYFKEIFGNPASHVHQHGVMASKAMDEARENILDFVQAKDQRLVFTSGATEANNLAILGMAYAASGDRKHILISEVEHYSVYNTMYTLKNHGFDVEVIPTDASGIVTAEILEKKLRDDTLLVSVMQANGEIGSINPIDELAKIAHTKGALFHTDATVSAGLLPIDFNGWEIDALTLSAHNFYGPKGVGALILKEKTPIRSISYGGWQEDGLRSGTENVPGIIGMGEAAKIAKAEMNQRVEKLTALQKDLWNKIGEQVPFVHFTGDENKRLPGHVSFWIEHVEGESVILFLNMKGISVASGSACSSNLKGEDEEDLVSSHVLAAVGVPTDICAGSVTISFGKDNKPEDVDRTVNELKATVERLLQMSPSYADYKKQKGE